MTTTLSVRLDASIKKRFGALAKRARRSKSFLAAEAIAAFVEAESWQLDETQAGLNELDEGRGVVHKDVSTWLRSWGQKRERKAPACDHRLVAARDRPSCCPS
jgi:RHH-type transcriptional regulator, rel operon repressor / antitoxin RelB